MADDPVRSGAVQGLQALTEIEVVASRYEREIRGINERQGLGPLFTELEAELEVELTHVYVFSRTAYQASENEGLKFFAFYQFPYSELSPERLRLQRAAELALGGRAVAWGNGEQWEASVERCNEELATGGFLLPFEKFKVLFRLFAPEAVDSYECLSFGTIRQINREMDDFLRSSDESEYPARLKELEKHLYGGRSILAATNLFHASAWIATLLVLGDASQLLPRGNVNTLNRALFGLRPLISEKMYHLVHENRFLQEPLADHVGWALGELHRLACSLGCTLPEIDAESRMVTFSSPFSPEADLITRATPLRLGGEDWRIRVQSAAARFERGLFESGIGRISGTLSLVDATRQALLGNARAAIMSRNLSHNIGSHGLAGVTIDEVRMRPRDVEGLLRYLQERMDFVARVSTEWPSWRQPQLFVRDVVGGWVQQGLLLDRIVCDDGYTGDFLELHVRLPGGGPPLEFEYGNDPDDSPAEGEAPRKCLHMKSEAEADVNDVLVSIPGGVVGRQALYALIENALRNAAKHNARREDQKLLICLDLQEQEGDTPGRPPAYVLTYKDNVSTGEDLCHAIQEKLLEELVDPESGHMIATNWGIQEMKVCADYLSNPFIAGAGQLSVHVDEKDRRQRRLWCEVRDSSSGESDPILEYRFPLQRPMLGMICGFDELEGQPDTSRFGLRFENVDFTDAGVMGSIANTVCDLSPALLYLRCERAAVGPLLTAIKEKDTALPPRILLKVKNIDGDDVNQQGLFTLLKKRGLLRRVYIDGVAGDLPVTQEGQNVSTAAGLPTFSQRLLIELYRRWVRALMRQRTGTDDPLNVVVYFDRSGSKGKQYAERWELLGNDPYVKSLRDLVRVFPLYGGARTNLQGGTGFPVHKETGHHDEAEEIRKSTAPRLQLEPWVARELDTEVVGDMDGLRGPWAFFDNHRQAYRQLESMIRPEEKIFYQYLGAFSAGKRTDMPNNRDSFDLLSNPPSGAGALHFLGGLVEAALLDVLVLDERVAGRIYKIAQARSTDSGLQYEEVSGSQLNLELRASRIHVACGLKTEGGTPMFFPTIAVRTRGISAPRFYLSHALEMRGSRFSKVVDIGEEESILWSIEGNDEVFYDVAIIHRAVLEDLVKEPRIGFDTAEAVVEALREVAARVVVTSGRGAQLEGSLGELPFVEFSAIQAYCKREVSKVSLTSILMSAIGRWGSD